MSTGLIFAPANGHDMKGHPEHAGRMAGVWAQLEESGVLERVVQHPPIEATYEQLSAVHSAEQIGLVEYISREGGGMIGGDTYTTAETANEVRLAAGSACRAVELVVSGEVNNAIALVRPPGHHAGKNSIEGFCLFNNIAIAARHARDHLGVERIAIIDFDVHHGNGTQDIFYEDNSVQFFSIHMFGSYFYPGSGRSSEDGLSQGTGYTINVPLPPGVGDAGYARVIEEIVEPLTTQFAPELILVSAGFDAHWRDPLAEMKLSVSGYADIAQRLVALADRVCDGRMVAILEGGYDIAVLGYGVLNLIYAMLKDGAVVDPIGQAAGQERDISDLIVSVQQQHLLI